MVPTPILFDYGTSPYSQKIHLFCAAAGITIKSCDQPPVLPRPTLESLGITYRKIPVLAIGKDLFADTSLIVDVLQKHFDSKLTTGPSDKAYEVFGNSIFSLVLRFIDVSSVPPSFLKDRSTIMPELARPDHEKQRPSAIAELRSTLGVVERQFLADGRQFIGGNQISLGDIHVAPLVRYLFGLGLSKRPGFGEADLPRINAWLARLPEQKADQLSQEETVKTITSSPYFLEEPSEVSHDPTELRIGDIVAAETVDAIPGSHPQKGKLVGLAIDTVTLQLDNELRIHFPRAGTIVTRV